MNSNGKAKSRASNGARTKRNGASGNTMRQISGQVAIANNGGNSRPIQNKLTTLSGSDFLTTIEVTPNPSVSERILKVLPISPSAFPGTRLTQMSQLWEFFKFTKFHVRYVPAVPTTLACQLVLYLDLDPTDDPTIITDPDSLIRQAVAQTGSQQWNFHTPKVIPLAMRSDRQFYFTGLDKQNVRFSQQGVAYLVQVTSPINFNGEPIQSKLEAGSLFIDWTVQFNIPQINPSAAITTSPTSDNPPLTVDLSDATGGGETYDVLGLRPRTFYVISHRVWFTDTFIGTLSCAAPGRIYATYRFLPGSIRVNEGPDSSDIGHTVVQSNDLGTIENLNISVSQGTLDVFDKHELVISSVYEEPPSSSTSFRPSRRVLKQFSVAETVPEDWDVQPFELPRSSD
jgi:hypothetical protein